MGVKKIVVSMKERGRGYYLVPEGGNGSIKERGRVARGRRPNEAGVEEVHVVLGAFGV